MTRLRGASRLPERIVRQDAQNTAEPERVIPSSPV